MFTMTGSNNGDPIGRSITLCVGAQTWATSVGRRNDVAPASPIRKSPTSAGPSSPARSRTPTLRSKTTDTRTHAASVNLWHALTKPLRRGALRLLQLPLRVVMQLLSHLLQLLER
jgi:hypothetical protein